jgi:hypothetical protein
MEMGEWGEERPMTSLDALLYHSSQAGRCAKAHSTPLDSRRGTQSSTLSECLDCGERGRQVTRPVHMHLADLQRHSRAYIVAHKTASQG